MVAKLPINMRYLQISIDLYKISKMINKRYPQISIYLLSKRNDINIISPLGVTSEILG